MPRQEKNRKRPGRPGKFPTDLQTTLNDILATLGWQEQLIRHAIQQVERRRKRRRNTKPAAGPTPKPARRK